MKFKLGMPTIVSKKSKLELAYADNYEEAMYDDDLPEIIPRRMPESPSESTIDFPHITLACTECKRDMGPYGGSYDLRWIGPEPPAGSLLEIVMETFHKIHISFNLNGYDVAAWAHPIFGINFEFVALSELTLEKWMNGKCSGPKLEIVSNTRRPGDFIQTYRVRIIEKKEYDRMKACGEAGV
ncbi:MAG: hypothetical protein MPK62_02015 [Alphaproteobacteria bacterium]|nr:hypothetical protein [Alphaproteobacteria bacterium]MDA8029909.1 hypothetical protein [Alphaproteobacteria bacterium]